MTLQAHHAAAPSYLAILSRFDPRITAPIDHEAALDPTRSHVRASTISPSPTALAEDLAEEDDFELLVDEEDGTRETRYDNRSHDAFLAASEPQEQDFAPEPAMELKLTEEGDPCVPLLAFTATWHRSDGLALGKVFEKIVWHGDWLDMIRGKW